MISIIICARNQDISPELRQNIIDTIGLEHEIIVIGNAENRYNIFSAYNKGVELSKYPILLFMHDDIRYLSVHWGQHVADHFKEQDVGAIGMAGTGYLSYFPGGWWSTGKGYLYLWQSDKKEEPPVLQNYYPENAKVVEVVALDGVWFCIRKKLFEKISFDEKTFNGFHFYDLDITLQVYLSGSKVLCVKDILIHHMSTGKLDKCWIRNLLLFNGKWKHLLPVSANRVSLEDQYLSEYRVMNEFISLNLQNSDSMSRDKKKIYWFAIKKILAYPRLYFYYKTPFWLGKLSFKFFKSLLN